MSPKTILKADGCGAPYRRALEPYHAHLLTADIAQISRLRKESVGEHGKDEIAVASGSLPRLIWSGFYRTRRLVQTMPAIRISRVLQKRSQKAFLGARNAIVVGLAVAVCGLSALA